MVRNNAQYFSHDTGMRNDPKILSLRRRFPDNSGYSIFCMMLEVLTDSSDFRIKIDDLSLELLSGDFGCEPNFLLSVIDFSVSVELLQREGDFVYSESLLSHLSKLRESRKRRSEAGKKGMQKRWNSSAEDTSKHNNVIKNDNNVIENDNNVIKNDNNVIENDNNVIENHNNVIENDNNVIENHNNVIKPDSKTKNKRVKKNVVEQEKEENLLFKDEIPKEAKKAPPVIIKPEFPYDLSFVPDSFNPAVLKWLRYKKERRESYKSSATVKVFFNHLLEYSGNDPLVADQVVEISICNNYQGIFPLKNLTINGNVRKSMLGAIAERTPQTTPKDYSERF